MFDQLKRKRKDYKMKVLQERKKELLPFMTVWIELEISQAVKDKHYMISPIIGT